MLRPLLSLALLAPLPAVAAETYSCTVEKFISTDEDAEFARKNARKTFTLVIEGDTITARVKSKDFRDHENIYEIARRDMLFTAAIGPEPASGLDTLVLPARPAGKIASNGHFNATVALQGEFFLNTWLLNCTE